MNELNELRIRQAVTNLKKSIGYASCLNKYPDRVLEFLEYLKGSVTEAKYLIDKVYKDLSEEAKEEKIEAKDIEQKRLESGY